MANQILFKQDYEEQFNAENKNDNVSTTMKRVLRKLDEYCAKNNYQAAIRHIDYWITDAQVNKDDYGRLMLLNEKITVTGILDREQECIDTINKAMTLAHEAGFGKSTEMIKILYDSARAYRHFEKTGEAIFLYNYICEMYEENADENYSRLAGLYNMMALALAEAEQYEEAYEMLSKALIILAGREAAETEMAVTYCNIAELISAQYGEEKGEEYINQNLSEAQRLLELETAAHDSYYAYVCENCALVFDHFGFFFVAMELAELAKEIKEADKITDKEKKEF